MQIYKKVAAKWPQFLEQLKLQTTPDEPNLILLKDFVKVLFANGVRLTEEQQEHIARAYPRG